ncbi:unnamed protein product [Caenorhabditis bovis]|uniref:DOMON domain-containing protein n=1 Tax=Caenorhabditis bovis TaxID=2654633 RepID=A0A8S1FE13_9PELO|nr:unnamed protein product [Caenorhabditis bovis]
MAQMLITSIILLCGLGAVLCIHVTHVSDCGTARGCWRMPIGCNDASDCETMITWKHEHRHLILEIESKNVAPGQWLGVGFSKDTMMGNDTVFECHFPNDPTKYGQVFLSHNSAKNNVLLETASQLLIRDGYAEIVDGKVMCGGEWILDNIHLDTTERSLMHVISSGRYHLFFAFGDIDNGVKKMHSMAGKNAPWKTTDDVRFCQRCSSSFANVDLKPDFKS